MPFVSLTRLRIRSVRFLPAFGVHTMLSIRQIRHSPGFRTGALLPDHDWTFWTMTMWDSQDNMRQYMVSGSHKRAMPRLLHWCDEASVAHWDQPAMTLPDWVEADRLMRTTGRISKVLHPSPQHASLNYRHPRTTSGGLIQPA